MRLAAIAATVAAAPGLMAAHADSWGTNYLSAGYAGGLKDGWEVESGYIVSAGDFLYLTAAPLNVVFYERETPYGYANTQPGGQPGCYGLATGQVEPDDVCRPESDTVWSVLMAAEIAIFDNVRVGGGLRYEVTGHRAYDIYSGDGFDQYVSVSMSLLEGAELAFRGSEDYSSLQLRVHF
jgi:hypothetical protein